VGWASKGGRTFVFVRQIQDDARHDRPAGLRARDALLPDLPARLDALARR
jgi:beta-lactamase class D